MKHFFMMLSVLVGMTCTPIHANAFEPNSDIVVSVKESARFFAGEVCEADEACVDLVSGDFMSYYITGQQMKVKGIKISNPSAAGVVLVQGDVGDVEGVSDYITWAAAFFAKGYSD